jgi:hypothetical protein
MLLTIAYFKSYHFVAYLLMFLLLKDIIGYSNLYFKIIHEVSGQSIQFQHIHGIGIGCILADLDAAQAKGWD